MVCKLDPTTAAKDRKRIEQEVRRRVVQQSEIALADVRLVTELLIRMISSVVCDLFLQALVEGCRHGRC